MTAVRQFWIRNIAGTIGGALAIWFWTSVHSNAPVWQIAIAAVIGAALTGVTVSQYIQARQQDEAEEQRKNDFRRKYQPPGPSS